MNTNPFTLGLQYLIEQAAKACDWRMSLSLRKICPRFLSAADHSSGG
ncbi:MAG: hypothetical protein ACLR17_01990 [Enterobacteriaceae bacterium]